MERHPYQKSSGDFPTVLYEVVNKRSSITEGTLSVEDVNNFLNEIAKSIGKQYATCSQARQGPY
jgi:DNA ligase-4